MTEVYPAGFRSPVRGRAPGECPAPSTTNQPAARPAAVTAAPAPSRSAARGTGTLTDCEAFENTGDGILLHTAERVVLRNCAAFENGGSGLRRTVVSESTLPEQLVSRSNGAEDAHGDTREATGAPHPGTPMPHRRIRPGGPPRTATATVPETRTPARARVRTRTSPGRAGRAGRAAGRGSGPGPRPWPNSSR
ncbi:right-handed parallel beta-helix repeat-containing protein [Streptomyces sp. NPDC088812]|uniref:right-handed parallel beta-helix repeat-containing protein n=1 Tax=Streptomyces sp. NPDC088812 TaxID=3365905 RepID=UPI003802EF45